MSLPFSSSRWKALRPPWIAPIGGAIQGRSGIWLLCMISVIRRWTSWRRKHQRPSAAVRPRRGGGSWYPSNLSYPPLVKLSGSRVENPWRPWMVPGRRGILWRWWLRCPTPAGRSRRSGVGTWHGVTFPVWSGVIWCWYNLLLQISFRNYFFLWCPWSLSSLECGCGIMSRWYLRILFCSFCSFCADFWSHIFFTYQTPYRDGINFKSLSACTLENSSIPKKEHLGPVF